MVCALYHTNIQNYLETRKHIQKVKSTDGRKLFRLVLTEDY